MAGEDTESITGGGDVSEDADTTTDEQTTPDTTTQDPAVTEEGTAGETNENKDNSSEDSKADSLTNESKEDVDSDAPQFHFSDFEVPEGMNFDESAYNHFEPLMGNLNLDKDARQDAITAFAEFRQSESERNLNEGVMRAEEQRGEHAKLVMDDSELGGKNFENTKSNVGRAVSNNPHGNILTELMQDAGLDNHPAFVGFLNYVGKTLSEDVIVNGGSRGASKGSGLSKIFSAQATHNTD